MPDIPDRLKRERMVQLAMRRATRSRQAEILAVLGNPPNVDNIPDRLWVSIEKDVADNTRRAIAIVFLLAVGNMGETFGHIDPDIASTLADRFATRRSRTLGRDTVSTMKERIDMAAKRLADADEATAKQIKEELGRDIKERLDQQAEDVGITETTYANTIGEKVYQKEFEKATGRNLTAVWKTERDERVCARCLRLDGTTHEHWGDTPDGPPKHPRCRCWLKMELVPEDNSDI